MNPVIRLRNDKGELETYGEIKGSKPKVAYYRTNPKDAELGALNCRDIKGNVPGSLGKGAFFDRERRQVR